MRLPSEGEHAGSPLRHPERLNQFYFRVELLNR